MAGLRLRPFLGIAISTGTQYNGLPVWTVTLKQQDSLDWAAVCQAATLASHAAVSGILHLQRQLLGHIASQYGFVVILLCEPSCPHALLRLKLAEVLNVVDLLLGPRLGKTVAGASTRISLQNRLSQLPDILQALAEEEAGSQRPQRPISSPSPPPPGALQSLILHRLNAVSPSPTDSPPTAASSTAERPCLPTDLPEPTASAFRLLQRCGQHRISSHHVDLTAITAPASTAVLVYGEAAVSFSDFAYREQDLEGGGGGGRGGGMVLHGAPSGAEQQHGQMRLSDGLREELVAATHMVRATDSQLWSLILSELQALDSDSSAPAAAQGSSSRRHCSIDLSTLQPGLTVSAVIMRLGAPSATTATMTASAADNSTSVRRHCSRIALVLVYMLMDEKQAVELYGGSSRRSVGGAAATIVRQSAFRGLPYTVASGPNAAPPTVLVELNAAASLYEQAFPMTAAPLWQEARRLAGNPQQQQGQQAQEEQSAGSVPVRQRFDGTEGGGGASSTDAPSQHQQVLQQQQLRGTALADSRPRRPSPLGAGAAAKPPSTGGPTAAGSGVGAGGGSAIPSAVRTSGGLGTLKSPPDWMLPSSESGEEAGSAQHSGSGSSEHGGVPTGPAAAAAALAAAGTVAPSVATVVPAAATAPGSMAAAAAMAPSGLAQPAPAPQQRASRALLGGPLGGMYAAAYQQPALRPPPPQLQSQPMQEPQQPQPQQHEQHQQIEAGYLGKGGIPLPDADSSKAGVKEDLTATAAAAGLLSSDQDSDLGLVSYDDDPVQPLQSTSHAGDGGSQRSSATRNRRPTMPLLSLTQPLATRPNRHSFPALTDLLVQSSAAVQAPPSAAAARGGGGGDDGPSPNSSLGSFGDEDTVDLLLGLGSRSSAGFTNNNESARTPRLWVPAAAGPGAGATGAAAAAAAAEVQGGGRPRARSGAGTRGSISVLAGSLRRDSSSSSDGGEGDGNTSAAAGGSRTAVAPGGGAGAGGTIRGASGGGGGVGGEQGTLDPSDIKGRTSSSSSRGAGGASSFKAGGSGEATNVAPDLLGGFGGVGTHDPRVSSMSGSGAGEIASAATAAAATTCRAASAVISTPATVPAAMPDNAAQRGRSTGDGWSASGSLPRSQPQESGHPASSRHQAEERTDPWVGRSSSSSSLLLTDQLQQQQQPLTDVRHSGSMGRRPATIGAPSLSVSSSSVGSSFGLDFSLSTTRSGGVDASATAATSIAGGVDDGGSAEPGGQRRGNLGGADATEATSGFSQAAAPALASASQQQRGPLTAPVLPPGPPSPPPSQQRLSREPAGQGLEQGHQVEAAEGARPGPTAPNGLRGISGTRGGSGSGTGTRSVSGSGSGPKADDLGKKAPQITAPPAGLVPANAPAPTTAAAAPAPAVGVSTSRRSDAGHMPSLPGRGGSSGGEHHPPGERPPAARSRRAGTMRAAAVMDSGAAKADAEAGNAMEAAVEVEVKTDDRRSGRAEKRKEEDATRKSRREKLSARSRSRSQSARHQQDSTRSHRRSHNRRSRSDRSHSRRGRDADGYKKSTAASPSPPSSSSPTSSASDTDGTLSSSSTSSPSPSPSPQRSSHRRHHHHRRSCSASLHASQRSKAKEERRRARRAARKDDHAVPGERHEYYHCKQYYHHHHHHGDSAQQQQQQDEQEQPRGGRYPRHRRISSGYASASQPRPLPGWSTRPSPYFPTMPYPPPPPYAHEQQQQQRPVHPPVYPHPYGVATAMPAGVAMVPAPAVLCWPYPPPHPPAHYGYQPAAAVATAAAAPAPAVPGVASAGTPSQPPDQQPYGTYMPYPVPQQPIGPPTRASAPGAVSSPAGLHPELPVGPSAPAAANMQRSATSQHTATATANVPMQTELERYLSGLPQPQESGSRLLPESLRSTAPMAAYSMPLRDAVHLVVETMNARSREEATAQAPPAQPETPRAHGGQEGQRQQHALNPECTAEGQGAGVGPVEACTAPAAPKDAAHKEGLPAGRYDRVDDDGLRGGDSRISSGGGRQPLQGRTHGRVEEAAAAAAGATRSSAPVAPEGAGMPDFATVAVAAATAAAAAAAAVMPTQSLIALLSQKDRVVVQQASNTAVPLSSDLLPVRSSVEREQPSGEAKRPTGEQQRNQTQHGSPAQRSAAAPGAVAPHGRTAESPTRCRVCQEQQAQQQQQQRAQHSSPEHGTGQHPHCHSRHRHHSWQAQYEHVQYHQHNLQSPPPQQQRQYPQLHPQQPQPQPQHARVRPQAVVHRLQHPDILGSHPAQLHHYHHPQQQHYQHQPYLHQYHSQQQPQPYNPHHPQLQHPQQQYQQPCQQSYQYQQEQQQRHQHLHRRRSSRSLQPNAAAGENTYAAYTADENEVLPPPSVKPLGALHLEQEQEQRQPQPLQRQQQEQCYGQQHPGQHQRQQPSRQQPPLQPEQLQKRLQELERLQEQEEQQQQQERCQQHPQHQKGCPQDHNQEQQKQVLQQKQQRVPSSDPDALAAVHHQQQQQPSPQPPPQQQQGQQPPYGTGPQTNTVVPWLRILSGEVHQARTERASVLAAESEAAARAKQASGAPSCLPPSQVPTVGGSFGSASHGRDTSPALPACAVPAQPQTARSCTGDACAAPSAFATATAVAAAAGAAAGAADPMALRESRRQLSPCGSANYGGAGKIGPGLISSLLPHQQQYQQYDSGGRGPLDPRVTAASGVRGLSAPHVSITGVRGMPTVAPSSALLHPVELSAFMTGPPASLSTGCVTAPKSNAPSGLGITSRGSLVEIVELPGGGCSLRSSLQKWEGRHAADTEGVPPENRTHMGAGNAVADGRAMAHEARVGGAAVGAGDRCGTGEREPQATLLATVARRLEALAAQQARVQA